MAFKIFGLERSRRRLIYKNVSGWCRLWIVFIFCKFKILNRLFRNIIYVCRAHRLECRNINNRSQELSCRICVITRPKCWQCFRHALTHTAKKDLESGLYYFCYCSGCFWLFLVVQILYFNINLALFHMCKSYTCRNSVN